MEGKTVTDWRKEVYYRYWMHLAHSHNVPAHYGIRTERYKLAFFYGLPLGLTHAPVDKRPTPPHWELYDLEKDPKEMKNVYAEPTYLNVRRDLKKRLLALRSEVGDTDKDYPEVIKIMNEHWDDPLDAVLHLAAKDSCGVTAAQPAIL